MHASIWLIGDVNSPDHAQALSWLRCRTNCQEVEPSTIADEARGQEPDLVLLCVSRPFQFTARQVESVNRAVPLARLIALVGPWCEGEVRSGRFWPGVTRIYWHQWQPRLADEVSALARPSGWWLPRTATDVDALLARPLVPAARRAATIGVVTPRHTDFDALAQALAVAGHRAVWLPPRGTPADQPLDGLVVDAASGMAGSIRQLLVVRSIHGPIPSVVVGSFLRPIEAEQTAELAGVAVVAKPFRVGDLLSRLDALLSREANPPQSTAGAAA